MEIFKKEELFDVTLVCGDHHLKVQLQGDKLNIAVFFPAPWKKCLVHCTRLHQHALDKSLFKVPETHGHVYLFTLYTSFTCRQGKNYKFVGKDINWERISSGKEGKGMGKLNDIPSSLLFVIKLKKILGEGAGGTRQLYSHLLAF